MNKLYQYISKDVHIAPLVVFRLVFGFVMFFSVLRFALKGWIYDQYIEPTFHFTYLGFSWVKPFGETGMYIVFAVMALSFLCVALGLFYRLASISALVLFTYVELLDKANYLNHYYFVSLVCFLLILVPAHRYFSLDVYRKPSLKRTHVPMWSIGVFKLQLGIVYFFAGVAKLNYEWLINANPLKIWLPAQSHIPVIGSLLAKTWVAYFASWFGAIYDLTVPFVGVGVYPRYNLYAPFDYLSISTGLPSNFGIVTGDDDSESFSILPLWQPFFDTNLEFALNFGGRANVASDYKFGGYIGAGFGYNYAAYFPDGENKFVSSALGPVFSFGLRYNYLGAPVGIRMAYMPGLINNFKEDPCNCIVYNSGTTPQVFTLSFLYNVL